MRSRRVPGNVGVDSFSLVNGLSTIPKGYKSAVIQDVPVSKPLSRADVQELQFVLDMAQEIPQATLYLLDLGTLCFLLETDSTKRVFTCRPWFRFWIFFTCRIMWTTSNM